MKEHRAIWSLLAINLEEELCVELKSLKWEKTGRTLMLALRDLFLDELEFEFDEDLHDRLILDFSID